MAHHPRPKAAHGDAHHAPAHPEAHERGGAGAEAPRAATATAPLEGADRVQELEAALEAAKAEAAQNWDRYLRERAEMENYKRRLERTYADQAKRAQRETLLKVLGVLDNLDRAMSYGAENGQEIDADSLLKGLRMTHAQFESFLAGEGLRPVETVGSRFDPAVHEAVATEVSPDKPEGEIVGELQKGYMLGDELLRPARVRVATHE